MGRSSREVVFSMISLPVLEYFGEPRTLNTKRGDCGRMFPKEASELDFGKSA
jgi:hypothetical protein